MWIDASSSLTEVVINMYVRVCRYLLRVAMCLAALIFWFASSTAQVVSPVSLVSVNSERNSGGNDDSGGGVISADGRYVMFASLATDLVSHPSSFMSLFVRDLQTATTIPVEVNRNGTAGANGPSGSAYLSTTGRYVAFESLATDLVPDADSNNSKDVFVRDLQTGKTTLVSVNRFGTRTGNGPSYWPKVSANGRFVVFTSYATDLVENYNAGEQGLFVRDMVAGTTTLIVSGIPQTIIVDKFSPAMRPNGATPEVDDYHPIVSADGRYLVCTCNSRLVANDITGPPSKAYVRDLSTGATSLVSVTKGGLAAYGAAQGISADGRLVLLESVDNLATDITGPFSFSSDAFNHFVRDRLSGETKLVTISRDG